MAGPAAIASAVIAGLGLVHSVDQGNRAEKAQDKAQDMAVRQNSLQVKKQEEEMNRMNMKKPDIGKLRSANAMATKPTTFLTSQTGTSSMGKTTMLGGGA